MKHFFSVILAAIALSFIISGCQSAERKAQLLYEAGRYQDVIDQYGDNPDAAGVVDAAKQVVGDELLRQGDFDSYLELWDDTPLADSARARVAEELFKQERYQEILDKYGDTPAAERAKIKLDKMAADSAAADSIAKAAAKK